MQNNFSGPPQFMHDPGEEGIIAHLQNFRVYLKKMAEKENDQELLALNFDNILEEDLVLFQRFRMGLLDRDEIERHERILAPLGDEVDTSKKLLAYMRKKLNRVIAA